MKPITKQKECFERRTLEVPIARKLRGSNFGLIGTGLRAKFSVISGDLLLQL